MFEMQFKRVKIKPLKSRFGKRRKFLGKLKWDLNVTSYF